MSNPSVSIVIPVYNRAHLVHRAIDSALAQTYPCEILVVDHGSTDDIGSVIKVYGNRIRYIRREIDNGPIAAWRDGAEQATGDYLHFTYDDDWIQHDFIAKCLELLSSDVAFVYTRAKVHGLASNAERILFKHPGGIRPVSFVCKFLLTANLTISPGCALFRTSDVRKHLLPEIPNANGVYGKNSGVGEDALLFLLTSLNYPYYGHVSETLADFYADPKSITMDAIASGSMQELKSSYSHAKKYYLSQPNAVRMPGYFGKLTLKAHLAFLRML